jgi:hypothetical protein
VAARSEGAMILDHTMREIRERNFEHFKRDALSLDQKALDIRDLLAYVDELIEELSYLEAEIE